MMADERDHWKKLAAESAVTQVETDMIVGLGTGSTAEFVLLGPGARGSAKACASPASRPPSALPRVLASWGFPWPS